MRSLVPVRPALPAPGGRYSRPPAGRRSERGHPGPSASLPARHGPAWAPSSGRSGPTGLPCPPPPRRTRRRRTPGPPAAGKRSQPRLAQRPRSPPAASWFRLDLRSHDLRYGRSQKALRSVAHVVVTACVAVSPAAIRIAVDLRARLRVRDRALHIVIGPRAALPAAGAMRAVRRLALAVRPAAAGTREDPAAHDDGSPRLKARG